MTDPADPASPACSAHEADDTYMGFAGRREIAAFLQELAAAEAAGRPCAVRLREMLPRIRDDVLHRELKARLETEESPESRT
jgi:hypothetical protein